MEMNIKLSFFKAPSPNKSPPTMSSCLMRNAEGKKPSTPKKTFARSVKGS